MAESNVDKRDTTALDYTKKTTTTNSVSHQIFISDPFLMMKTLF